MVRCFGGRYEGVGTANWLPAVGHGQGRLSRGMPEVHQAEQRCRAVVIVASTSNPPLNRYFDEALLPDTVTTLAIGMW